jgi:pimeloyl-ACP methyl ester carboxylesterase
VTNHLHPSLRQPAEGFCDATNIAYLQAGETGAAVVLLHGWSAFKEIWWSTMLALAPDMQVYAPDMPGHGATPLQGSARMSQVAERIGRFCAARGLGEIALVGHSMGGNVALELALARPDLVRRLVLADPAVDPAGMPAFTRSYLDAARGWAALRASMALARPLSFVGGRVSHAHRGGIVLPALRRASYMARHDPDALRALLDGLFANPLGPRLAEVRQPTLVITGEFDPLVPPALSRRVAAAIPAARFAVVLGAAHTPMDERPREFARILREFLAEAQA